MRTADRWQRVQEIFDNAVDLTESDQAAYLDRACREDAALRAAVERLLRADRAGDLIESAVRQETILFSQVKDPLKSKGKVGKFEVLAPVGEGGFGVVYKGRDPMLQRFVAIKACSSQDKKVRQRFFREAQIAAGLQHPNIVTVHDLGIQEGVPYLVQEFLSGEDLDLKISQREALALDQRLDILVQVARGLEFAHQQGVIHRDVKPGNVRVLANGVVKLLDFGIARLLDEESRLTSQGMTMGTVGYMSPEQLRGDEPDRRSDIFAFGVLAYELLAYERPFKGETFSEVAASLLEGELTPLLSQVPDCPAPVAAAIERCLSRDPTLRQEGFTSFLEELTTFRGERGSGDPRRPADQVAEGGESPASMVGRRASTQGRAQPEAAPEATAAGRAWLLALTGLLLVVAVASFLRSDPTADGSTPSAVPAVTTRPTTPAEQVRRLRAVQERLTRQLAAAPPRTRAPVGMVETGVGEDAAAAAPSLPADDSPGLDLGATPDAAVVPPSDAAAGSPRAVDRPRVLEDGPGVVPPQLLAQPEPAYPDRARRERREARVVVSVLVDRNGRVANARVKLTSDPTFDFGPAAAAASRAATFLPATHDGVPGLMWVDLLYVFRLR
jgi:serine/threonine-protein kinase